MKTVLCQLHELPDQGAREFEVSGRSVLALRDGSQVYVYLNICPHLGTPLNWEPDQFLNNDGAYIRCSTHGALFIKDSGECILGPCRGMPLSSVPVTVENNEVSVKLAPLRPYQPFPAKD
jgi:nitrite reductase/ring-hydroxylating ferredoxin subunit